jgi:hypothetical protein
LINQFLAEMDAETSEADEEGGEEMAEAETDDGEEMEELADAGIALPQASPICVCKVLPPIPPCPLLL